MPCYDLAHLAHGGIIDCSGPRCPEAQNCGIPMLGELGIEAVVQDDLPLNLDTPIPCSHWEQLGILVPGGCRSGRVWGLLGWAAAWGRDSCCSP